MLGICLSSIVICNLHLLLFPRRWNHHWSPNRKFPGLCNVLARFRERLPLAMSRPLLSDLRPTGSPGRCVRARLVPKTCPGMLRSSQALPGPGPDPGFHAQAAGSRERGRCLDRESGPAHYKPVLENWVRAQRGGGRQKLGKLKYFWKLWWIIFWN